VRARIEPNIRGWWERAVFPRELVPELGSLGLLGMHLSGKPIASFQLTQEKLVNMMVEIEKGTLLALHLGRMKEKGTLSPEQISFGKLNNVREAIKIARQARTILGGNGVTLDYSPMRHANNLESVLTYEGTSEVHTLVLGQTITGIPAFR
jgi:glutaryl-CoA dehydrogenase